MVYSPYTQNQYINLSALYTTRDTYTPSISQNINLNTSELLPLKITPEKGTRVILIEEGSTSANSGTSEGQEREKETKAEKKKKKKAEKKKKEKPKKKKKESAEEKKKKAAEETEEEETSGLKY
eukprot:634553-Amorphochlora_amoeboformis.AAC.1